MVKVKINEIQMNTYNPRKLFRSKKMTQLKNSIKEHGQLQPITLRRIKDDDGNEYIENITGTRRLKVMADLGCEYIEAIFKEDVGDYDAMLYSLVENIQRDDLTSIEEGRMYQKLADAKPDTKKNGVKVLKVSESEKIKQVAKDVKKSAITVRNKISLLKLSNPLQTAIENKTLNVYMGYELARLSTHDLMKQFRENIKKFDWDFKVLQKNITKELNKLEEKKAKSEAELLKNMKTLKNNNAKIRKAKAPLVDGLSRNIEQLIEIAKEKIDGEWEIDKEKMDLNNLKDLFDFIDILMVYYENEDVFQEQTKKINQIENRISKIHSLINSATELDINICPFCEAEIEIDELEESIKIHQEALEKLKGEQTAMNTARMNLETLKNNINSFLESIKLKNKGLKKSWKGIIKLRKKINELKSKEVKKDVNGNSGNKKSGT